MMPCYAASHCRYCGPAQRGQEQPVQRPGTPACQHRRADGRVERREVAVSMSRAKLIRPDAVTDGDIDYLVGLLCSDPQRHDEAWCDVERLIHICATAYADPMSKGAPTKARDEIKKLDKALNETLTAVEALSPVARRALDAAERDTAGSADMDRFIEQVLLNGFFDVGPLGKGLLQGLFSTTELPVFLKAAAARCERAGQYVPGANKRPVHWHKRTVAYWCLYVLKKYHPDKTVTKNTSDYGRIVCKVNELCGKTGSIERAMAHAVMAWNTRHHT